MGFKISMLLYKFTLMLVVLYNRREICSLLRPRFLLQWFQHMYLLA